MLNLENMLEEITRLCERGGFGAGCQADSANITKLNTE